MLFFSLQGSAKILVVSDIDDTLKVAHVLMTLANFDNSIAISNHFQGMNSVFRKLELSQDVQFAYVSNAPSWLMGLSHGAFLAYNSYPEGGLYLRSSLSDRNFKLRTISQLIRQTNPDMVILIGDNGEVDPVVYKTIATRFTDISVRTFIHQVYSQLSVEETGHRVEQGQLGFATSVDLAYYFHRLNLISQTDFEQLVSNIVPQILSQDPELYLGELTFPNWMDCRDFRLPDFQLQSELLSKYQEKVRARCSKPL